VVTKKQNGVQHCVIEDNVPLPLNRQRGLFVPLLRQLKVGQSVVIPRSRGGISTMMVNARAGMPDGTLFTASALSANETRVWRIA
jgi:hypothetical protein